MQTSIFYFFLSTRLNTVNHSFIGREGAICITLENAIPKRPTSLMKNREEFSKPHKLPTVGVVPFDMVVTLHV